MGNKLKQVFFVLFVSGAVLYIFRGAFQTGLVLFGHDFFIIYHPFRIFADYVFGKFHDLPLWMPNLFFGVPMIASSSLLYYYPTDIIFMLLGINPMQSATIDVIIHLYAAYIGMYLFLRRENLSREASFLGALFVMFSGYILSFVNAGHINNIKAGALIPLVFYFIRSGLIKNSLKHFMAAGLVMGLQILATGMQVMAYTVIGASFFVVYRLVFEEKETKARINVLFLFSVAAVFSLLFSAAQFLPSYDYKDFSWRGEFTYESFISWSQHPVEFLTMLFPHMFGLKENDYFGFMSLNLTTYYMGLMPFILAPFAFMFKKERRTAYFWSACALIFLLLSFGGYTPLYAVFYKIPVYNQFRNPSRFMYQFSFFVAALGALGFDSLLKRSSDRAQGKFLRNIFIVIISLAFVLSAVLFTGIHKETVKLLYNLAKKAVMPESIADSASAALGADIWILFLFLLLGALTVWLIIKGKIKSAFAAVMIFAFMHFFDIYRIEKEFINYIPGENIVPYYDAAAELINKSNEKGRVADFLYLWGPNRPLYYNLEAVKGAHGMQPLYFGKMEAAQIFNNIEVNRALNIRWYVSRDELSLPGVIKKARGKFNLYEDMFSKSRVIFTTDYLRVNSDDEALSIMSRGLFDGSRALVAFNPPFTSKSNKQAFYNIPVNEYKTNEIKFTINADDEGFAQISNLYYKRIKAKIDGKPAKTYRVNYAFTAVYVPKGLHEIILYYDRKVELTGLVLSFLSLVSFAFICLYKKKSERQIL